MIPISAKTYLDISQIGGADSFNARNQKAVQSAREFEGQLLSSVFGELERTFTALGTPASDPGAENYRAMAMQALGKAVAQNGGIGLAAMIVHRLLKPEGRQADDAHSANS